MVGVTIGTLKDNILDPISEMVGPENYKYIAGSREVYICGRRILIRGANDEAAEKKIRGLTLAGVYGDELTLWPQNYFKRCLDRLSVRGAKMFGTTNPDSPYHWLKTDYLDREDELNLTAFHFELIDNPNLPPEYVEDLKREFSGLWYKRFIQGLWVVAEGAIYDMFDDDTHVIKSWAEIPGWQSELMPPWEEIIDGIDYGTANPTVFIRLGLWRGIWYAFTENRYDARKVGRQRTDAQHSLEYRNMVALTEEARSVEIDPSAASFRQQLKIDGVRGLHNADHDVLDGIRVVARGLTTGRFMVHQSCAELRKEFATYVWDEEHALETGQERPIKQNDHSLDATRYGLMRAIGRREKRARDKAEGE